MDINQVLSELYKLLAADKISPRRGAVMAYTCNLLLRTIPAINDELEPEKPQIILDLPRPKRDDPVDPERVMYARLAKYNTSGKVDPSAARDGYDGYTSILEKSK